MPAVLPRSAAPQTSASLHSVHPTEPPALAINSEPCAVSASLWTQQLAAGRQALFLTVCSPSAAPSCPAAAPPFTAPVLGGLIHCRPRSFLTAVLFNTLFFFTSSFLHFQLHTHTHPLFSHTAGLGSLSVFLLLSSPVKLSICLCLYQLLLHYFNLSFLSPPSSPPPPAILPPVYHAGSLDELSFSLFFFSPLS